jgi:hypothetical protein
MAICSTADVVMALGDAVRDDAHDDVHGMGDDARSDHDVGRSR